MFKLHIIFFLVLWKHCMYPRQVYSNFIIRNLSSRRLQVIHGFSVNYFCWGVFSFTFDLSFDWRNRSLPTFFGFYISLKEYLQGISTIESLIHYILLRVLSKISCRGNNCLRFNSLKKFRVHLLPLIPFSPQVRMSRIDTLEF